jgi:O-antigen ligase
MSSTKITYWDNFVFSLALVGIGSLTWTGLGQTVNYLCIALIALCTLTLRLRHNFNIRFKGVSPLVYASLISTMVSFFFALDTSEKVTSIRDESLSDVFLINSENHSDPIVVCLKWIISLYILPTFIVTIRRLSNKKYDIMLLVWVFSVSFSAFFAVLQSFGFFRNLKIIFQSGMDSGRFAGLSNHPNTQAILLCLTFPILFILFRRKILRLRWLIFTGLIFEYAIFLSGSRNGIICSVLIIAAIFARNYPSLQGSRISTLRISLVLFIFFFIYLVGLFEYTLQNTRLGLSIGGSEIDASSRGRLALLHYGVQLFSSFPITGIGPSVLKTFHNIYLQIAGSFGIIGLIAFFNYIKYLLRIDFSSELRFEYRLIVYVFLIYGVLNNNLADFYLYFPLGLCYSTLSRKSNW